MLGDYAAAEADLRDVIVAAESAGQYALSSYYRFLAEALLGQDRAAEALVAGRHAWRLAHDAGNQEEYLIQAWRVLGRIASRLREPIAVRDPDEQPGQRLQAEACFAESLRLSLASGMEGERAQTLREWARHDLQSGDREQGVQRWQEARAIFAQIGLDQEAQRMTEPPS